jgi:hypothetical protein
MLAGEIIQFSQTEPPPPTLQIPGSTPCLYKDTKTHTRGPMVLMAKERVIKTLRVNVFYDIQTKNLISVTFFFDL